MFTQELKRHIREVRSAIFRNRYQQHANGIEIAGANAIVGGQYSYRVNKGEWSEPEANLLPTQGLIFLLNLLGNHAAIPTCSIALYANAYTPIAANVALTFTSTYSEITSGSEGYSEATRVAWVSATAATTAVIHNNASPAEFTIVTASSLTVNGVAMLTASAKGATTGNLISASLFGATRTFSNTDLFDVKYQLGLTSS